MDNKKFEQLIDLIINENEEQARVVDRPFEHRGGGQESCFVDDAESE